MATTNDITERLRADLELAAKTLRRYQELHIAKGTPESMGKASANAALADRFEATLAATPEAQPAGDAPAPVVATWRERVKYLDRPTDFAERCAAVEEARDLRWALEEAYARIASMRTEWGAEVVALTAQARHAEDCLEAAKARIAELDAKLNTPQIHDFAEAVVLEAAHQRELWPDSRDVGKQPSDWFWLVGHLAGKALHAATSGNKDKTAHHTISTAAALANWHAFVTGEYTDFRPGIDPVARGIEQPKEPA